MYFSKYLRLVFKKQKFNILPLRLQHYNSEENQTVFVNIRKKTRYPFLLFSALFAENHQKLNKNDGITSILLIVT